MLMPININNLNIGGDELSYPFIFAKSININLSKVKQIIKNKGYVYLLYKLYYFNLKIPY